MSNRQVLHEETQEMNRIGSLEEKLMQLLADKLKVSVGFPDEDLIENGMLDSLMLVDLLLHVDQEFGVLINLEQVEIDDLRSVSRIARLIAQNGERQP